MSCLPLSPLPGCLAAVRSLLDGRDIERLGAGKACAGPAPPNAPPRSKSVVYPPSLSCKALVEPLLMRQHPEQPQRLCERCASLASAHPVLSIASASTCVCCNVGLCARARASMSAATCGQPPSAASCCVARPAAVLRGASPTWSYSTRRKGVLARARTRPTTHVCLCSLLRVPRAC